MAKKFEVNIAGFEELRKSPAVEDLVRSEAEKICERAKGMADADGYIASTKQMPTRVIASVITDDLHAVHSNAIHNTLLKALGG